ncbi:unnamed protein product [Rotaria socialis]|uniref:G domain-containing protein n=1 Tax=Rotaria socialis TaxID=392032 RepID=A0A818IE80_9BILA|nr:unnamed protein product [Rotaria socialis]CAF4541768.1 unnamed protein product [Rotaria socialis]
MPKFQHIRWNYPQNEGSGFTLIPRSTVVNQNSDQYFLELATRLKNFDVMINHDLPYLLRGCLKERLRKAQQLQMKVMHKYMNDMKHISTLLHNNRNDLLNQKLRNELKLELNSFVNELSQYLQDLEPKARFIDHLKRQYFEYFNVAEQELDLADSVLLLENALINNNRHVRILCSNDVLNNAKQSKLNKLRNEILKERKTNRNLQLIYADFSYCPFDLHDMIILPFNKKINEKMLREPSRKARISPSSTQKKDDFINILLIGESGVGKSTFINAFANYLTFNTLEQAKSNKPTVLIPVSFLITTGDNFQEHKITFGKFDSTTTEDFNHPGQSVTQRCRSYVFALNHIIGKKVRIIDTPGFGDTRGLDQDDINIQHILECTRDLTHLDAICFLLKPNATRLHTSFRTCLTQLFDLLGPNASQNILFCFTNARSTFYTSGDTAPLLRSMLDSLSIRDIPFKKANTFFFDSESSRYLIALHNGIRFNGQENEEYFMSWSKSVDESNRLLNYVCKELHPYSLHNGWQSVKHAQFEIVRLIRPILEAMRNILRNFILWDMDSPNKSIVLWPQPVPRSSKLCTSCQRHPIQAGNFWIMPDNIHEYQNRCLVCSCHKNQHIAVDYKLKYKVFHHASNYEQNQMNDLINRMNFASIDFAYFLINVARSTTEDPFLVGLLGIIEEEKQICVQKKSNHLNSALVKELDELIVSHKEQMKKIQSNPPEDNLEAIYERINTVCTYPMIREQIAVIRENKNKHRDKHYEVQVSEKSARGNIYLSTPC